MGSGENSRLTRERRTLKSPAYKEARMGIAAKKQRGSVKRTPSVSVLLRRETRRGQE
jgi:hypothetical protein